MPALPNLVRFQAVCVVPGQSDCEHVVFTTHHLESGQHYQSRTYLDTPVNLAVDTEDSVQATLLTVWHECNATVNYMAQCTYGVRIL